MRFKTEILIQISRTSSKKGFYEAALHIKFQNPLYRCGKGGGDCSELEMRNGNSCLLYSGIGRNLPWKELLDHRRRELCQVTKSCWSFGRIIFRAWTADLKRFGYNFPEISSEDPEEVYRIGNPSELYPNCHQARLHFCLDLSTEEYEAVWKACVAHCLQPLKRAEAAINNYKQLDDWCVEANSSVSTFYPLAKDLARDMFTFTPFRENLKRALVITNNYNLRGGMALQVKL